MGTYILKRLILLAFVIWGITTITFVIIHIVPRNPAIAMAGSWARPEQIEKFTERWGLNLPVWQQYYRYYWFLLRGDLGTSIRTERPVLTELLIRFPATFELATVSILFSMIIGIPLGLLSAVKRNSLFDNATRGISLSGVSIPNFWLGLLLLLVFYYKLGWAVPGRVSPIVGAPRHITGLYLLDSLLTANFSAFLSSLKHIVVPAFTLGFFGIGIICRLTRSGVLDVLRKDYITAARARGIPERTVIYKHVLRNALIPTVTVVGVLYGAMLAGAIVVEAVFAWPGLGYFMYLSIFKADQPAIMGGALLIAIIYSVINLFVDISYRFFDPRIKY